MAIIQKKITPYVTRSLVVLNVVFLLACEATSSLPVRQIYMQTEDSHPHEVLPGRASRFPFWTDTEAGYVDVKCFLSGPTVPVELKFTGIKPIGWAAENPELLLGPDEIQIDIEGIIEQPGSSNNRFELLNHSSDTLLWHQCYNN